MNFSSFLSLHYSMIGDSVSWHKWFAWHPVVTLSGNHIWLKIVYRRSPAISWPHSENVGTELLSTEWQYGTIFDVLKDTGADY